MILKVRLAHSMDEDFIEVEVQKSELTYAKLMEVCCSELSLNPKYVERLRKLPNTRLRNDRDVQRIGQLQVCYPYQLPYIRLKLVFFLSRKLKLFWWAVDPGSLRVLLKIPVLPRTLSVRQ